MNINPKGRPAVPRRIPNVAPGTLAQRVEVAQ
jgi:hypothetical protein